MRSVLNLLVAFVLFPSGWCAQTWLQLQDFPGLQRDDGIAVTVNGKIFVGSGLTVNWTYETDFYSFDPGTNTWSAITPMPDGSQRQYACGFPGTNSFFIFSGDGISGPLNTLLKYDILTATWSVMSAKPGGGLIGASALCYGDNVIIVGGKPIGNGPPTNEVWEYKISSDTWTQKNNFPFNALFRASAAVIHNIGYLMFGLDANNRFKKSMYSYNQFTDTWTKVLDFPQPKGRAYANLQRIDDQLILFGGYDSLNVYHKDVWYYNPLAASWTQTTDFVSFGRKGGMGAVVANKFYYTCGINVSDTRLKETWVLDVPLDIKENDENNLISIGPNPATDFLYVRLANKNLEYTILLTDVWGRPATAISRVDDKVDISNIDPGVYILKIYADNRCLGTNKLIKTR